MGMEGKEDTCPVCLKKILKPKTKNILIPFVGFYETIASEKVDSIAFRDFIDENNIPDNEETGWLDVPEDMSDEHQEAFWDEYYPKHRDEIQKQVAIDYIDGLSKDIDLPMTFESIDSPRFYNYGTDRLFVDVPEGELLHFYNRVDKKILAEMIKENHTSRDGFASFYDDTIEAESWKDPEAYDHNQWTTVIEAYIKQNDIDVDQNYYI